MHFISRVSAWSFLLLALFMGCRSKSDSSDSPSTTSTYGCSFSRDGAALLCTEYSSLTGTNLATVQSNCTLKGNGYSWAAGACTATGKQTGKCTLPVSAEIPVTGAEYFYTDGFSDVETRKGMCTQQGGTYE